jgi:hypothetical protein
VTLRHLSEFCNWFVRKFDSQLFLKGWREGWRERRREGGVFTVCALQTHTCRHTLLHVIGEFIPLCGEHVSSMTPTLIGTYLPTNLPPSFDWDNLLLYRPYVFLVLKQLVKESVSTVIFFNLKKLFFGGRSHFDWPITIFFGGNYEHSLKLEALLGANHWGTL